jgi:methionyl-tRNA formyltransferase
MNGDAHTGVCIVKVVEKMDAGPILGVARTPVPADVATPELEDQLSVVGADLLLEVLQAVQERRAVEIPQDEREATYAKKFEKNDGRIDWRKPAAKIQNFVRALQPWPCAFTFQGRSRISIHKVKANRYPAKPNHQPGTLLAADAAGLRVATADGDVTILEIQPESKRRMTAAEYVNGYQPKPGVIWG